MSYIRDTYCTRCKATTPHLNNKCTMCLAVDKRVKELAWHKLSPDEKIEELRARIEALEKNPSKY